MGRRILEAYEEDALSEALRRLCPTHHHLKRFVA